MSEINTQDIYHAWFSKKQKGLRVDLKNKYNDNHKRNTKSNIYLSLDGIEVEITEVNKKMTNHSERFSDSQYLGKVSKWIKGIY